MSIFKIFVAAVNGIINLLDSKPINDILGGQKSEQQKKEIGDDQGFSADNRLYPR